MESKKENTLSISFADSLKEESLACIGEYAEIGLDAIMEDGILKEIPIVNTAIALYKIGNSIKDRHNLKKILIFINAINNGIVDEEKRNEYQQKFQSNEKFRNQEIEYLLVLIDRCVSYDKPKILANLYMRYLDNLIGWNELTMYAEVIDRLLTQDIEILCRDLIKEIHYNQIPHNYYRLEANGLLYINDPEIKVENGTLYIDNQNKKIALTAFGEKLVNLLLH